MARHSFPSPAELWRQHEEIYVSVFTLALDQLPSIASDTPREDRISETLCPILRRICYQKSKDSNREISPPSWNEPIPPATNDEIRGDNSNKKPDFTCKLVNYHAAEDEFETRLHVECKLLGLPTSATWILNKNYVGNGIKRFDSESHGYGKQASSGIMIGYIVSMERSDILRQVNSYQNEILPGYPELGFEFEGTWIPEFRQQINRTHIVPNRFELIHLWVDLRASSN
jgi:hypothetical protein